jgi:hypothetical protein
MTPDPYHPVTDVDAPFSAISPEHTCRLMEALREKGFYFAVTVNGPKDDPSWPSYDIFWFRKEDDQEKLGAIIRATIPKK